MDNEKREKANELHNKIESLRSHLEKINRKGAKLINATVTYPYDSCSGGANEMLRL